MYKKGRKSGQVKFEWIPTNGARNGSKDVQIAGDFTEWQPVPLKKQKTGAYSVTLDLNKGSYQYKFQIDGQWQLDPDNDQKVQNNFGTLNNVVTIE